jgi:hypothetical protein
MVSGSRATKAGTNQRLIVPSTRPAMPWLRAIASLSSHMDRGGISLAVSHSDSDSTRSGWRNASCCPIMPPIDRPTKCTASAPVCAISAAASSASNSMLYGPGVVCDAPWPRVS